MTPEILKLTAEFIIVNKPAGLYSVPPREGGYDPKTILSHWLREQIATLEPTSRSEVLVVHRLDRFTSGLMIFARTPSFHQETQKLFEKRKILKEYLFLASPTPTQPVIRITEPIEGKPAETIFEVLKSWPSTLFYGKALPKTGRFHQIRLHASLAGFPLLGDHAYGAADSAPRVMLHSHRLKGPFGDFRLDPPADFQSYLKTNLGAL